MRIARIITRLNVGGPAIQALLLTSGLDPAHYETLLVCGTPGPREGDIRDLRPTALVPVVVPSLGREISPLADALTLMRLAIVLRRFRPDIVHTHLAKAGVLGRIAARLVGVPVVVHTFHGNVLHGYFGPVRSRLFVLLEQFLAKLSTRVIAISPSQRAELLRLRIGDEQRIVEIPLGFDLSPFRDLVRGRLRAELGIGAGERLVGIVGRLVPIKGVDLFLRAAAVVARDGPVTLVIAGDGEQRPALERLADDLGLGARARFLGWRADVANIYADLDVLALTSHNEGTPVSLIEGLASGCAVCATGVGGVPDLVGEPPTAVLVTPDENAIADGISGLLADPDLRRRLGERGRERAFGMYGRDALVARIDSLYASLASPRR